MKSLLFRFVLATTLVLAGVPRRGLAGETAGDMFVKSPLLAFAAGSALYRLDGACLSALARRTASTTGGPP